MRILGFSFPFLALSILPSLLVPSMSRGSYALGLSEQQLQDLVDSKYKATVDASPWMGISVGIITPNNGATYYSYGQQNLSGPAVTQDTIYAVNSMTKVFTSVVLADLNNQHRLLLDDPIQPFIPDHVMPTDGSLEMTFLDLATHWSGLTNKPTNLFWEQDDPYAGYTDEMFFADLEAYSFDEQNLHVEQQYYYSNYGYGLLGYVLSDEMYQSSFKSVVEKIILLPLQMNSSALTIDDPKPSNFANGHEEDGTQRPWGYSCESVLGTNCVLIFELFHITLTNNLTIIVLSTDKGSWAIRSTAADILKFLSANMEKPGDSVDRTLLAALKLTQIPRRPTDEEGYSIGLGWRVQEDGTHLKSGSGDGFEGIMFFNTNAGTALIVLSNSYINAPNDTTTTGTDIFAALLDAYLV